jgi:hypothetical protein
MTGRTEAEQDGVRVVEIMVAVGCVEVHSIPFSGSSGEAFRAVPDMAMFTHPACLFLTLFGYLLPIMGIQLSPFGLHKRLRLVGKYRKWYTTSADTSASGQVLCTFGLLTVGTECLLLHLTLFHRLLPLREFQ